MICDGIRECLPELIERVESGAGWEGRENDQLCREIALVMGYSYQRPPPDSDRPFPSAWFDPEGRHCGFGPPHWLRSLDAVVSLIEQKLPEANCHGYDLMPKEVVGYVSRNCIPAGERAWMHEGCGKTPARALLAACLRALQAHAGTLADAHSKNPPEAEHG